MVIKGQMWDRCGWTTAFKAGGIQEAQAGLGMQQSVSGAGWGRRLPLRGPRALTENVPHWLEARSPSQRRSFGNHSRALELEDTSR